MTREEMLWKLHELSFCIFWPDDWDDIGYTERPIWANSMGYGYYACDEPCRFEKIKNIPAETLCDVKTVIEIGNKYDFDLWRVNFLSSLLFDLVFVSLVLICGGFSNGDSSNVGETCVGFSNIGASEAGSSDIGCGYS